ncbi:MAG: hypothetical protein HKN47_07610 [Pirellulaceae bacterium]|nr:hypothetical protein [Pirellulaceae bacterium]
MPESSITVRDLRRLWKPHKERLSAEQSGHPTVVRFHRACSWIQLAEQCEDPSDLDQVLLSQWIAFNALYGQWDAGKREPRPDRASWRQFSDRMLRLDNGNQIVDALVNNKRLVITIFEDEYLCDHFWEDPSDRQATKSRQAKFKARSWYVEGRWTVILDDLLERIYLLRCQLVHGAATYNSALNRVAIRRCSLMMEHLLRSFLLVWVHDGSDENWGEMCYPPINSKLTVQ